jgi:hypothetical protein
MHNSESRRRLLLSVVALCGLSLAASLRPGVSQDTSGNPSKDSSAEPADAVKDVHRIAVDEARRRAILLHNTYVSTLRTVHRIYFEEEARDVIPARALEEVFRQNDLETGSRTRWISVNTPAMNVDHSPQPGFEKEAARVLATGKHDFELVKDGMYHRAGALLLSANCTKCHLSGLRPQQRIRTVAALVISMPIDRAEPDGTTAE